MTYFPTKKTDKHCPEQKNDKYKKNNNVETLHLGKEQATFCLKKYQVS